jgi:hypothetical protein
MVCGMLSRRSARVSIWGRVHRARLQRLHGQGTRRLDFLLRRRLSRAFRYERQRVGVGLLVHAWLTNPPRRYLPTPRRLLCLYRHPKSELLRDGLAANEGYDVSEDRDPLLCRLRAFGAGPDVLGQKFVVAIEPCRSRLGT